MKQSWYWTGIAISIAQTIGLHRSPDGKDGKKNGAISEEQRRLWRNIWWGRFLGDSWLAFGMGRPLRIKSKDCDCPMPTLQDSEENFKNVVINGKVLFTPDLADFANLWLELLSISGRLHEILRIGHGGQLASSRIESLRTELAPRSEGFSAEPSSKRTIPLTVATRQLNLHRLAERIAFFRPDTNPSSVVKVQVASNTVNAMLENSMADGTVAFLAPTIVPLVVPAM